MANKGSSFGAKSRPLNPKPKDRTLASPERPMGPALGGSSAFFGLGFGLRIEFRVWGWGFRGLRFAGCGFLGQRVQVSGLVSEHNITMP